MNKEQMITLLRSVGVNESTITVMSNAFDLGFESAKEQAVTIARSYNEELGALDIEKLTP
jgi:hypothetical protein